MLDNFVFPKFLPIWLQSNSGALRSPVTAIVSGIAVYLSLVRLLRFQRVRALKRKYGDAPKGNGKTPIPRGRPDVKLTVEEAQDILLEVNELEMPGLMRIAVAFALFKTYATPTISEILLESRQFSTSENVAKRFTDTSVLISTWTSCPIMDFSKTKMKVEDVDPRSAIAIARVNWLHSRWPNIKNEDLLYTMSLFVTESIRWAKQYGWRELLPIEQEAFFITWKEIGHRMQINDIPETLEGLYEWCENYQEVAMVPAQCNFDVAQHTLGYILATLTERFGVRSVMRQVSISLLQDPVREAFLLPKPPIYIFALQRCLMSFFAIRHRYFSLPRFKRVEYVTRAVPAEKLKEKVPRFHPAIYDKVPWYKPEAKGLSRLAQNILWKIGLLEEDDIPGPKFKSEGYRLEECGPTVYENVGHAEVMKMAAEIQGCPVVGIFAR